MPSITHEGGNSLLGARTAYEVAGKTTVQRVGADITVRFHGTDIITVSPQNEFTYQSGGYRTKFTLIRMNEFGPAEIKAQRGVWVVLSDAQRYLYHDGLVTDRYGRPLNAELVDPTVQARLAKLDTLVRVYIDNYAVRVAEHGVGPWEDGTCAACNALLTQATDYLDHRMEMTELGRANRPSTPDGEPMGYQHYLEHVLRRDYVPGLLEITMFAAGAQQPLKRADDLRARPDIAHLTGELQQFFRRIRPSLVSHLNLITGV
jgi:hypothetical protein